MTEEKKLIARLRAHSYGALEKLIELYTPYVSVIVYNVIGTAMSREDAEEVVSDVFLSLWRPAGAPDANKGTLRAYLAATARNAAKNKLRRTVIHDPIDDADVGTCGDISEDVEKREERAVIIDIIKSLGEPDSEIFIRYYYYDEKISKIAAATGLHTANVKTRLSRGRKKIKEILVERGYGDEQETEKARGGDGAAVV